MALKRILFQISNLHSLSNPFFQLLPYQDPFHLTFNISPPPQSIYAQKSFRLSVEIPKDYPFKAPKLKFLSKIYHPNINSEGFISYALIYQQFNPKVTIKQIIQAFVVLLDNPELEVALNIEATYQFQFHREDFLRTVDCI